MLIREWMRVSHQGKRAIASSGRVQHETELGDKLRFHHFKF